MELGKTDFAAIAEKLGKDFAARAEHCDESDSFVTDNYAALKTSGLVEAAVPTELGGGGATVALSEIAQHVGRS